MFLVFSYYCHLISPCIFPLLSSLSIDSRAQMWWLPSSSLLPCLLCRPALWFSWLQRNQQRPNTCSLSVAVTLSSTGWLTTYGTWWGGYMCVCVTDTDSVCAGVNMFSLLISPQLNYLVPATCCVIILFVFDLPAYTSPTNFPAVLSLFLLYGWDVWLNLNVLINMIHSYTLVKVPQLLLKGQFTEWTAEFGCAYTF